jgi:hypothetical protein
MSKKFTVVAKLQNFSGDVQGNLYGTYVLHAVTLINGVESLETTTNGIPGMGGLSSISVNAKLVHGEDPLVTLDKAFSARTDLGTVTDSEL